MLFEEQLSRFPNKYPWTQDFIEAMWKGQWFPMRFNFQSDEQDYKVRLTEQEQAIVRNAVAAVAQIEVAPKKFWAKLGDNFPHPYINDLGIAMSHVEIVHNAAYEKLLQVLHLESAVEDNLKNPIIQGRVKYLHKYNHKYYKDSKKQYIYSIILFTLFVEYVSLFSQFYILMWFSKFNNMFKDLSQQICYTSAEEVIHSMAGIRLINTLREEYPELFDEELEARIYEECEAAWDSECRIVDWMLGDYEKESLNSNLLKEFIKERFNWSLTQIGYKPIWSTDTELLEQADWFDLAVNSDRHTDFFHAEPTSYSKVSGNDDEELF